MRKVRIPKGRGSFRVVVVPTREEKRQLRQLMPQIAAAERRLATARGVQYVAHGFVTGRNPVTNAEAHVGPWLATISMDLANWFDTVRQDQIEAALVESGETPSSAKRTAKKVVVDGVARQGLPTSPAAANLAAVGFDAELTAALDQLGVGYRYTRYADDLAISVATDERGVINRVIEIATEAAKSRGWSVAEHKTRVYFARSGRRIVTGVAVDHRTIYPTRRVRRRLRAARHSAPNDRATHGLAEWARLPLPRLARDQRRVIRGFGPTPPPEAPAGTVVAPRRTSPNGANGARVIRLKRKGGEEK